MCDLSFKSPRVDDLPQRSIRSQRQQVARDVKGPRLQRALVRFLLHLGRLGRDADQVLRHMRRERLVLGEEKIKRLTIERASFAVGAELRRVIAAFFEVLIAGRTLLPVPALLVGQLDSSENREPLYRQRDVRQVGNRAVTVLEVESVKKLLG